MTILWSNNASTTIAGSITPASLTVTLAAGTGAEFPSPTGGDYFCCTFYDQATKTVNEICHCTSRTGDVCTIVRAQEGTTAKAWNAGDIFANLVTAGTLASFVQTGTTPAANTTIVYTGDDTSTTPNLIIANTNPVPASLVLGMQFNIRVKNSNSGPTNLQLNGAASVASTRQNGKPHTAGDLTATEEMIFVYNGVNFTSMVMDIVQHPPQNIFYVRPDGNDNNSGLSNTSAAAFLTIYGAIAAIQSRYISQLTITLNVADGTYVGGVDIPGGYVASWNIVGNVTNPGNVVIDATSLTPPAGASISGHAFNVTTSAVLELSGFTLKGYYSSCASRQGGRLNVHDCNVVNPVAPAGGAPARACFYSHDHGNMYIYGVINHSSGGHNCGALWFVQGGGNLALGYHDDFVTHNLTYNFTGSAFSVGTASAYATNGGGIGVYVQRITWSGRSLVTGPQYNVQNAAGIATDGSTLDGVLPGTAGIIGPLGWVN